MNDVIDFDYIDENGPQEYHGTYEVPQDELGREEVAGAGTVIIHANVDKGHQDDEYVAEGSTTYTADLECSRCAEPYPFANTSPFHVRFLPRPEPTRENEEVEIASEEELDVEFYSDRTIPLREFALEQVQLTIPMKPLCDESCLGLCPTCGVNLSREKCSCNESITDERWGALKDLREELAKKKNV
jgi:uncharacterized protein